MCLLAQPVGNAGGFSYLYTVAKNFNLPSIQNVTYEKRCSKSWNCK
nr:MAG TPA: antimicrobial protein [Caudoviricetes sp.]